MKIFNFTCKEKLSSLLNKTCSQTIRKAWIPKANPLVDRDIQCYANGDPIDYSKPPKFKVGDKIDLIWNEDSRYDGLCKFCYGDIVNGAVCDCNFTGNPYDNEKRPQEIINKNLGTVEIKKVYLSRIQKSGIAGLIIQIRKNRRVCWRELNLGEVDEFRIREGFDTLESMRNFLDTYADLSEPREFWTYEMEYIDG